MSDHPLLRGFEFHEELESTNDLGLQLAKASELPCPYLIQAARQSKGRGRGEHRWWSSAGAITCSLILDSEQLRLSPAGWPLISLVTGMGLAEALQAYLSSHPIRVKWPNDLYVGEQKLGGILIETVRGEAFRFVVGFGINVNNPIRERLDESGPRTDAPSDEAHPTRPTSPPIADSIDPSEAPPREVARRATSLIELLGRELPIQNVLWSALNSLGHHYRELAESRYPLLERWPRYCFLTGRKIQIRMGDRLLAGVCQGIDARGALTLATATGQQSCFAGEVEWEEKGA